MPPVADIFALAWQHHQANDLPAAEQLYRQILQVEPGHVDSWCFLGAVLQSQGKFPDAENHFRRAVQLLPGHPCAQNYLGIVLAQQGKWNEAAAAFRQFILYQPTDADAHNNLGMVLMEQGRLDEAIGHFQRALQLRPDYGGAQANLNNAVQRKNASAQRNPRAAGAGIGPSQGTDVAYTVYSLNMQGVELANQGQLDEARARFERVLMLQPDNADAHNNLGIIFGLQHRFDDAIMQYQRAILHNPGNAESHYNLGTVFQHQGRFDEAVACYKQALQLNPKHVDAHSNLGIVLLAQKRPDDARASFEQALQLKPDHVDALNNLGNAWLTKGQMDEAAACYRQALQIKPDYAVGFANLGHTLERQGKPEEAIDCFRQAIAIDPRAAEAYNGLGLALWHCGQYEEAVTAMNDAIRVNAGHVDAHVNRSLLWLLLGNFAEGWQELEWRWRHRDAQPWLTKDFLADVFHRPRWDGSPLEGRTVLVMGEQGLGDTLQLIRYVPLIKAGGGKVIVQCQRPLIELLGSMAEIDQLLDWREPVPPFDVQMPMLSLPAAFGTSLDTIPSASPYLFADAVKVERWRQELESSGRFKIGITWQGSRAHKGDHQRSVRLAQFAPLSRVPKVDLYSLQVGPGSEQIAGRIENPSHEGGDFPIVDLGSRFDAASLSDAAAAMMSLDLVVTVDTGIAHLAGALGVPVWVALPFAPDWRWLLQREDSPWYPTMRLFRQSQAGKWDDVFDRIAASIST